MNNMNLKFSKKELYKKSKAIVCIIIGTLCGIISYQLFIFFNIAIFGWNLGLIFAPLIAGYVETYLALKYLHESTGAVSAFVLFIVTVIYGFIITNPTLGFNIITIGSTIVIMQAAFPILINYILLVIVIGILSYFLGIFKKITDKGHSFIEKFYYNKIIKKPIPMKIMSKNTYDEFEKCEMINSRNFHFLTTNTTINEDIENYLGLYVGTSSFEKETKIISSNRVKEEKDLLDKFKLAKFQALNNLADLIEKDGGNGVVDLKIEYELIDQTKGRFQVIAHGTAIKIKK